MKFVSKEDTDVADVIAPLFELKQSLALSALKREITAIILFQLTINAFAALQYLFSQDVITVCAVTQCSALTIQTRTCFLYV